MHRELSAGLLQGGASTYYHVLDNRGRAGGSSMPPHALSDISNSRSRGSFVYKHEFRKPPPLLDKVDSLELDNTAKTNTINNINNNKVDNNFLAHGSSNHADIGFRVHSHINFKNGSCWAGGIVNGKGSLLSFEQNHQIRINQHQDIDDCSFIWKDDGNNIMSCYGNHNSRQVTISDARASSSSRFHDEITNFNHQPGNSSYDRILNSASTVIAADGVQEIGIEEGSLLKRPYTGNQSAQLPKKQCTAVAKDSSSKPKMPASSKDPQRVAAKNRRERISERLKILQELVPNGPKVDLVTMLEKAIGYVKFLQLQVKVLTTDEFWPAQGGKAPEISQVKEAIDATLASQQDRSSSSM